MVTKLPEIIELMCNRNGINKQLRYKKGQRKDKKIYMFLSLNVTGNCLFSFSSKTQRDVFRKNKIK